MDKVTVSLADRLRTCASNRQNGQREVAPGGPLAQGHHVWLHTKVFYTKPSLRAPKAGHHFVSDEEQAIPVANLGYLLPVALWRYPPSVAPLTGSPRKAATRLAPWRRISVSKAHTQARSHVG